MQQLLEFMGLNNAQSGLIRSEILRRTRLNPSHIDGDVVLLVELSLYGKFVKIPKPLFFRREKPETATTLQGVDTILRYIDPELRHPHFQHWKLYRSYFGAVTRADVPWKEKWCAYRYLGRRLRWARSTLYEDIRLAMGGRRAV
jgi:hypothetical protein